MVETREITIENSRSVIGFATKGDTWFLDRYLTIGGKDAFHIGNVCGTCEFFFERMEGAEREIEVGSLVETLNRGLSGLQGGVVDDLKSIMPDGKYIVLFADIWPELCSPGSDNDYFSREQAALWAMAAAPGDETVDPKTDYYRLSATKLKGKLGFFEFLVPTFSISSANPARVEEYRSLIAKGGKPTVVSLGVLDIKQPCEWDEAAAVHEHWCLAHYLLDGHHKAYAAALSGVPITMISFIAVEQGVSSREDLDWVLKNAFAM